jgi:hypothetical protein
MKKIVFLFILLLSLTSKLSAQLGSIFSQTSDTVFFKVDSVVAVNFPLVNPALQSTYSYSLVQGGGGEGAITFYPIYSCTFTPNPVFCGVTQPWIFRAQDLNGNTDTISIVFIGYINHIPIEVASFDTFCDRGTCSFQSELFMPPYYPFDTSYIVQPGYGCSDTIIKEFITIYQSTIITYDTLYACDSVIVSGQSYYQSNFILYSYPNFSVCDSTHVLTISISNSSPTSFLYETTCQASLAGIDTLYLSNASSCDSLLVIQTNYLPPTIDSFSIIACDSIALNGNWYFADTTFTDTLTNISNTCDSIVYYSFQIQHSVFSSETLQACDSVNVAGNWCFSSQVLVQNLTGINTCDSIHTTHIHILDNIQGSAFSSNGNVLQNAVVYLIQLNVIDSSLEIIDSVTTDINGFFNFQQHASNLYVKVLPDIVLNPNDLPTYYGNIVLWQQANSVACTDSMLSITCVAGINPGGTGFISGFINQGAGKAGSIAFSDAHLLLLNSQNEYVAYKKTDAQGYFSFDSLLCEAYYLVLDDVSFNFDDLTQVNLMDTCQKEGLVFVVNDGKIVQEITGIKDFQNSIELLLFPNPAYFDIEIILIQDLESCKIFDVFGNLVLVSKTKKMDLSHLASGLYFLQVETRMGMARKQFVKI